MVQLSTYFSLSDISYSHSLSDVVGSNFPLYPFVCLLFLNRVLLHSGILQVPTWLWTGGKESMV